MAPKAKPKPRGMPEAPVRPACRPSNRRTHDAGRWVAGGRALAAAALVILALPAAAQTDPGVGVSPARVDVPAAQPGESYQATLQVQNRFADASTFTVEAEGAAGAWATTDPPTVFTVGPRSSRMVKLTIAVPEETGPGTRDGLVRFTTEEKDDPDGAGTSVRFAVAVVLNVTVGGMAQPGFAWGTARIPDAQAGTVPTALWPVTNTGNVRATARATVTASTLAGAQAGQGTGTLDLDPGQNGTLRVPLDGPLAVGQYQARLRTVPAGSEAVVEATLHFKVVASGTTAPDGTLRALLHNPQAAVGKPLRVDAMFENTGTVAITSARFHGEVRQGGELVATLTSESLTVQPGEVLNLTSYWEPEARGHHRLTGHVTYDGYQSETNESQVDVTKGKETAIPGPALGALAAALAAAALLRREPT